MIQGDKNQIHQVIINLIINAADAMDKKGTLTIRTYRNKEKRKVYLEIADTGCGIDNEKISKIFDPFYTTKSDGSGIGLSICQRIIADHKGTIAVSQSAVGGAEFCIRIPVT